MESVSDDVVAHRTAKRGSISVAVTRMLGRHTLVAPTVVTGPTGHDLLVVAGLDLGEEPRGAGTTENRGKPTVVSEQHAAVGSLAEYEARWSAHAVILAAPPSCDNRVASVPSEDNGRRATLPLAARRSLGTRRLQGVPDISTCMKANRTRTTTKPSDKMARTPTIPRGRNDGRLDGHRYRLAGQ